MTYRQTLKDIRRDVPSKQPADLNVHREVTLQMIPTELEKELREIGHSDEKLVGCNQRNVYFATCEALASKILRGFFCIIIISLLLSHVLIYMHGRRLCSISILYLDLFSILFMLITYPESYNDVEARFWKTSQWITAASKIYVK